MVAAIPPLLGLHAYEAAARHLSFAAAAAEMHLSASAVSQRVRTLETHLGVQLFERLPRSLRLTPLGEAYLPAVRDVFLELSAATTDLFETTDRASLTVRVQIAYATTWLAPRLPDFCASFPHIDLKLVSAIWADALPPSEIDLEIRQGNGAWPGCSNNRACPAVRTWATSMRRCCPPKSGDNYPPCWKAALWSAGKTCSRLDCPAGARRIWWRRWGGS